ncbi:MAG TPA: hypothetical protein VHM27_14820, partial [Rhizomicrobium sp.]|nr:hypothetical protein [Rhizomicrobium sp.]
MMLQECFQTDKMQWLANARAAARRIAREKGTVTIDEVRECCPPPAGVDPRVMGAVMQPREFQMIKFVESRRKA